MSENKVFVSVPADRVKTEEEIEDEMIRRASVPSLGTLFDRGKKSGLIKPVNGYGGPPPAQ